MQDKFDFSYESYGRLLRIFKEAEYEGLSFLDRPQSNQRIILRHDIDIDIYNCEAISELELSNGYSSTWFFQPNNDYYNPLSKKCMKVLRDLSEHHILGLHIDPSLFPDLRQLERGIRNFFDFYSCYFDLKNVFSFHRPAKYLNDASVSIDGFVNAYDPSFMETMAYVSDSNRRPFFEQNRLWDSIDHRNSIILLTHPLWWHRSSLDPDQLYMHLLSNTEINICRSALTENITLYSNLFNDR